MKRKLEKSILIPDGESPVLMVVLSCLSEIKGLKIYVMSNQQDIPMKPSKNIYNFAYYPETASESNFIDNINTEVEKHNIDLIFPIFEHAIRTITKHVQLIKSQDKLALLPSFANFNIANNKGLLAKFLKDKGLPFPKSQIFKQNTTADISLVNYPVLVKPVEGEGGGTGIYVFHKREELAEFMDSDKFNCTYLAQDYVEGHDIDCSVICKDGEILAHTIQTPIMHGTSKFSPQFGIKFLQNPDFYAVVKKLIKELNWSGVAHLDARYDKNSNQYKIIELNPRFWGSVEASLFAGINFPYLYCLSPENLSKEENTTYKEIEFYNLKGLVQKIKANKLTLFNIPFILNHTPFKYMLKDPKPTLFRFIGLIKRKVLK